MRIALTLRNGLALAALSFAMQEAHELSHTAVGLDQWLGGFYREGSHSPAPSPGRVRVWLNVYSPRSRSPAAASTATRRTTIVKVGAAFRKAVASWKITLPVPAPTGMSGSLPPARALEPPPPAGSLRGVGTCGSDRCAALGGRGGGGASSRLRLVRSHPAKQFGLRVTIASRADPPHQIDILQLGVHVLTS